MKVAIVHDWLTGMRGGEYVLEAICEMFPSADLFTLVNVPGRVTGVISSHRVRASWLQKLPGAESKYRSLLPIMPLAVRSFDLRDYALVVSSSHCVAKGARKGPEAVHVSYVHAPMRYMWLRFNDYFGRGRAPLHVRVAAAAFRPFLRAWDRSVSGPDRVDSLIANSAYIASQIDAAYGRRAAVIHPFADLSRFSAPRRPGSDYLMVGAFAPYKRIDLAIEAFNRLALPLKIVGSGQEEARLRPLAGPTVEFLGALPNDRIAALLSTCRAFVFPGAEDFGITPVEAMAAGAPVIAFAEGGALETVTERTGLFFRPQTVDAIIDAVRRIESGDVRFTEEECRRQAAKFTRSRFRREFADAVRDAWRQAGKAPEELESVMRLS